MTRRHRRPLSRLVRRLAGELPDEEFRSASRAGALACDAFDRDRRVRSRVAALLLADMLGPLRSHSLRLAA
jgi:hypothetical protein